MLPPQIGFLFSLIYAFKYIYFAVSECCCIYLIKTVGELRGVLGLGVWLSFFPMWHGAWLFIAMWITVLFSDPVTTILNTHFSCVTFGSLLGLIVHVQKASPACLVSDIS